MKSSVEFLPNKHCENITKMFKKLYTDEVLADVTLCCKDGSIKAHKVVLAASSPYFHRIFTENKREHLILIMHGIPFNTLNNMIELIYKGNVSVLPESLNPLYELAGEFQLAGISGVLRNEHVNPSTSEFQGHNGGSLQNGRDTRFRGMKRVAVDYTSLGENPAKRSAESDAASPVMRSFEPSLSSTRLPQPKSDAAHAEASAPYSVYKLSDSGRPLRTPLSPAATIKKEPVEDAPAPSSPKLSAWARKLRKFKCDLCPSSFKRSSHLSRHQLVHTGERPFACGLCDKAFSRHDKLKHHVRKNHEEHGYETDYNPELGVSVDSPSPPPFIISHVASVSVDDGESRPKRGRGRPRKYPVVVKTLPKRPRGRPRSNPNPPKPADTPNGENYDITNLPYGDLEFLTMSLQEPVVIEPLVEIKTEKDDSNETEDAIKNKKVQNVPTDGSIIKSIETRIATIGECTISVANH